MIGNKMSLWIILDVIFMIILFTNSSSIQLNNLSTVNDNNTDSYYYSISNNNNNNNSGDNEINKSREIEPRSLLSDMARELMTRTGTNSQVLSLNLTNLIILLVLKGLLFGAAFIGSGSWKGRSLEQSLNDNIFQSTNKPVINESELLLFLSYLLGETTGNYDCIKRVACSSPKKATEYILAGKMFLTGNKLIFNDAIPVNAKYENLMSELQYAINYGKNNGNCDDKYSCSTENEVQ